MAITDMPEGITLADIQLPNYDPTIPPIIDNLPYDPRNPPQFKNLTGGPVAPAAATTGAQGRPGGERIITSDKFNTLATNAITAVEQGLKRPFPTYEKPDISNITEDYNKLIDLSDEVAQAQLKAATTYSNVAAAEVKHYGQAAEADIASVEADTAKANILASIAKYYGDAFGLNGVNDKIGKAAVEQNQLFDEGKNMLAEIEKLQSIQFFDNPLAWIQAHAQLPDMINAYNAHANRTNAVGEMIDRSTIAADLATNFVSKTVPTITAAQAIAKSQQIKAKSELLMDATEKDMSSKNFDFNSHILTTKIAMQGVANSDAHIKLYAAKTEWETQVQALLRADTAAQRMLMAAQVVDTIQDKHADADMLTSAEEKLGLPPGSFNQSMYRRLPREKQAQIAAIAAGSAGINPADAYRNYTSLGGGGPLMNPTTKHLLAIAKQAEIDALNSQGAQQLHGAAEVRAYADKFINDRFFQMEQNPESNKGNNPFVALPPKVLFATDPTFAASPVGKALQSFQTVTVPPSTGVVISTIRAAFPDNNVAAQAVAQYFQKNVQARNMTGNYSSMAIDLTGTGYKYVSEGVGVFGTVTRTTDLTNPAQVRHLMEQEDRDKLILQNPNMGL